MQEQHKEKLSLLLDNELDDRNALALLKAVHRDPELNIKLRNYSLISQALRTEEYAIASVDFVDRIHQQVQQEPTYFLPSKKKKELFTKSALAVAASLVLSVVWVSAVKWQKMDTPYSSANLVTQRSVNEDQMNARFKEYLQAHDNVLDVNNVGAQSYARLANYQQQ